MQARTSEFSKFKCEITIEICFELYCEEKNLDGTSTSQLAVNFKLNLEHEFRKTQR